MHGKEHRSYGVGSIYLKRLKKSAKRYTSKILQEAQAAEEDMADSILSMEHISDFRVQ